MLTPSLPPFLHHKSLQSVIIGDGGALCFSGSEGSSHRRALSLEDLPSLGGISADDSSETHSEIGGEERKQGQGQGQGQEDGVDNGSETAGDVEMGPRMSTASRPRTSRINPDGASLQASRMSRLEQLLAHPRVPAFHVVGFLMKYPREVETFRVRIFTFFL